MASNNEPADRILFTEKDIRKRAREIGEEITKDFKGQSVVLIGTLKGAVIWMSDVMKEIDLDTEVDFVSARLRDRKSVV